MVTVGRLWKGDEIATLTAGECFHGAEEQTLQAIAWDTRRLRAGSGALFIALRNIRDGHIYLPEAYRKGASAGLGEKEPPASLPYIRVENSWTALYRWAKAWRESLPYPLLALTGSVGKTWIKEWLAYLLEGWHPTVRTPASYNSRLGVPISLLSFSPSAALGIVEAGISAPGEMQPLAELIQPTYGLLTPMGSAHDEHFPSFSAKVQEKLFLFKKVDWLIALEQPQTLEILQRVSFPLYTVGLSAEATFRWVPQRDNAGIWHLPDGGKVLIQLPGTSAAIWQNALLAASAAYLLGCPVEHIQSRLSTLPSLPHRLQWIYDTSGRLWLNDTSHADTASAQAAVDELLSLPIEPKTVILTDFSPYTPESHRDFVEGLREKFSPEQVHLIGPTFFRSTTWGQRYESLEDFLLRGEITGRAVLLKGSRRFRLEEALPTLTGYGIAPELHIDWEKVYHNLSRLRSRLPPQTRLLAMLKAEAYGSGDLLMASFLQRQGVEYIGVAYIQEALRLRKAGISLPLIVFYPGREPLPLYQQSAIEVAVGTWEGLEYWAGKVPLHIEFDTGMGRMGFMPTELEKVCQFLKAKQAEVKGVFSHLALAEQPTHPRTEQQIHLFDGIYTAFRRVFPEVAGHLLNTAGVLHIGAKAAYDLVRIGIGLYGIGEGLEEATALYAPILRVETYPDGTRINYGFTSILPRKGKVATIAIGYGDGLPRSWAEKGGYVFWQGQKVPILPPLNMDLMLAYLEEYPVRVGETVEIWGPHRPLRVIAEEMGTSPYEVLVRLSHRVRRVYTWGGI
ncbi:MAG: alanine racemase [Bacteroidia bacterium]|nr:alanine racemase [Bacteroidia bacterium]